MITKSNIETAYCFFHQKLQVYAYSTLEWQRDDIEIAIADYVSQMDKELYSWLAADRADFLLNHDLFQQDLEHAVEALEAEVINKI